MAKKLYITTTIYKPEKKHNIFPIVEKGKLWLLENMVTSFILERDDKIILKQHNSELYDSSQNNIFNTLQDIKGDKPIAKRNKEILGLCSHMGVLYDFNSEYIFNTLNDPEGNFPLLKCPNYALYGPKTSMTYHDGITHLFSNNNRLILRISTLSYDLQEKMTYTSNYFFVINTPGKYYGIQEIKDENFSNKYDNPIFEKGLKSFFEHENILYEFSPDGKLYRNSDKRLIFDFGKKEIITTILSCD
jgi:hypothetical protein